MEASSGVPTSLTERDSRLVDEVRHALDGWERLRREVVEMKSIKETAHACTLLAITPQETYADPHAT